MYGLVPENVPGQSSLISCCPALCRCFLAPSSLFRLSSLSGSLTPGTLDTSLSIPTKYSITPGSSTKLRGLLMTRPCSMRLPTRPIPPSSMYHPRFRSGFVEIVFSAYRPATSRSMGPTSGSTLPLSLTPLYTIVVRSSPASRTLSVVNQLFPTPRIFTLD